MTKRLAAALVLVSAAARAAPCPPLPAPSGTIVRVTTEPELQAAVRGLASDTTILVADGTYDLTNTLHFQGGHARVALRGESGDRDAVVLRGLGMTNASFGNVPHGILVSNVTDLLVADLTIRDVYYHAVQIKGESGASRVTLHDVRLLDAGEQLVKGSTAGSPGPYADDCVVECSLLEYTDRAPSWYTNGVDVLAGARWIVRDNTFVRIRAPRFQLAGPAVLFWRNSLDTIVERNVFIDCDRGVALGLSAPDANSRDGELVYDHQGGIIRNNAFYRSPGSVTGDVGISVAYSRSFRIVHNTVLLESTFPWTIEWRFASSAGEVANNLTDGPFIRRDGATATLTGNVSFADSTWFVDVAGGDFHLEPTATWAIDQVPLHSFVRDDLDGDVRPHRGEADVGADEDMTCTTPTLPVENLFVTRAGSAVVLAWDSVTDSPLYNAWYVTSRFDCPLLSLSGRPTAIPVAGCAEPTPTAATTCTDVGAVGRPSLVHYYNVRPTCGGAGEGP